MNVRPSRPRFGATSVSQISVSIASTWQKKGRSPLKWWLRQCCKSRAVSGVTCQALGSGICRHSSTRCRRLAMMGIGSYCCASLDRPWPSSRTIRR